MRRAARTDATHAPIIETLRKLGWLVADTHSLPNFVDAVAFKPTGAGGVRLLEIKSGAKAPMTDSQKFMVRDGWPICILRSVQDAIDLR